MDGNKLRCCSERGSIQPETLVLARLASSPPSPVSKLVGGAPVVVVASVAVVGDVVSVVLDVPSLSISLGSRRERASQPASQPASYNFPFDLESRAYVPLASWRERNDGGGGRKGE